MRTALPDLIFVSMENWDEIWRRNQFVCAAYLRRHPGKQILFVGLPHDVTYELRCGRLKNAVRGLLGRGEESAPGISGLTLVRPVKLMPNSLGLGRKVNDWLFRRATKRAARKLGLQHPLLWLNPHSAVHMAGQMGECGVLYDITDDWTSLSQPAAVTALITEQDKQLCALADATIVCSEHLYSMKEGLSGNLHLVRNGVDAAHYAAAYAAGPAPEAARDWVHPVLGYTGSIHGDRVDVPLIAKLARQLADNGGGTVALVGPVFLEEADRAIFAAEPNVKLTGPVAYTQLPLWMRAFDACITPHLVTSFTESLNPIKLWEYLATGKTIIATPVAGFRDYTRANMVRLATDASGFMAAWSAAAASPEAEQECQELRRREALSHSWDSRMDDIEAVIAGIATGSKLP